MVSQSANVPHPRVERRVVANPLDEMFFHAVHRRSRTQHLFDEPLAGFANALHFLFVKGTVNVVTVGVAQVVDGHALSSTRTNLEDLLSPTGQVTFGKDVELLTDAHRIADGVFIGLQTLLFPRSCPYAKQTS